MKSFLAIVLFLACLPLAAQTESVDELEFESKSINNPYKPKNNNYAFIRSKRGKSGVNKNAKADSILTLPINEIVLVYTELNSADAAEREEANKERWENLLKTYPEYFENYPTYINVCQCNAQGDTVAFKKNQGFYIYFEGDEPVAAEPEPTPVAEPEPQKEVAVNNSKPEKSQKAEKPSKAEKKKEVEETPVAENKPDREERKKEKPAKVKESKKDEADDNVFPEPVKEKPVKRAGYSKPKRSKDPKACRPACYENGDEDLYAFFRDNITLSKKQKRKGKNLVSMVRLQLNFDGSIKKAMVTGADAALNEQVNTAIKSMNLWNPAVKNGLTVKSEVKMTLKFDKETKSMKPFDIINTPRPGPKCKCVSDAELFGD